VELSDREKRRQRLADGAPGLRFVRGEGGGARSIVVGDETVTVALSAIQELKDIVGLDLAAREDA
jgi:hypothetical protein